MSEEGVDPPMPTTMEGNMLVMLEEFVGVCNCNSIVVHLKEMDFYRDFIRSLGGKIPPKPPRPDEVYLTTEQLEELARAGKRKVPKARSASDDEESANAEAELSTEGVIEDNDDEPPEYGDETVEVSDANSDKANKKRKAGEKALKKGDADEAVKQFTEAIVLNPMVGHNYSKRASAYLQLNKPKKALLDSNKAVEKTPKAAHGYKWRGWAYRLLGKWEEAFNDLSQASGIDDGDTETNAWLKEVTTEYKKIAARKRKQ